MKILCCIDEAIRTRKGPVSIQYRGHSVQRILLIPSWLNQLMWSLRPKNEENIIMNKTVAENQGEILPSHTATGCCGDNCV